RDDRRRGLLSVDPDHGKIVRFCDLPVPVGPYGLLRYRISDIAAHGHDGPWSNLGHNIAMGRHPGPDVVVGRAAASPALTNDIPDLRRELGDAVGPEWIVVVGDSVVFGGARIYGV